MEGIVTRACIIGNNKNSYPTEIKPISRTFTESTLLPVLKQIVEFCAEHLKEETESVNKIKTTCEQIWGHESYCDQIRSCCDQVIDKIFKTNRSIIHLCQSLTNLNITPELSTLKNTYSPELCTEELDSTQDNTNTEKVLGLQLLVDSVGDSQSKDEKTIVSKSNKKGSYMVTTLKLGDADLSNQCIDVGTESSQGPYLVAITHLQGDSSSVKLSQMHPESHDIRNDQSQYMSDEDESCDEGYAPQDFSGEDFVDEDGPIYVRSNETMDNENKGPSFDSTYNESIGDIKEGSENFSGEVTEGKELKNDFKESNVYPKDIQTMQVHVVETFTCHICLKIFHSKASLIVHEEFHKRAPHYQCIFCPKMFTTREGLNGHVDEKHGDLNDWEPGEEEEVEKRKAIEIGVEVKVEKVDEGEAVKKEEMAAGEGMKEAKKKEPAPKCGICDVCGKFVNHVRKHKVVHRKNFYTEKHFQCEECGKTFNRYDYFNEHKNNHSGIKPYCCPVCNKCFSAKASMRKHIKIHSGDGKHVCEVCGKRSHQKHNLVVHMRTHTGHKPFSCKRCGRKFAHNVSVRDHKCIPGFNPADKKNKMAKKK